MDFQLNQFEWKSGEIASICPLNLQIISMVSNKVASVYKLKKNNYYHVMEVKIHL